MDAERARRDSRSSAGDEPPADGSRPRAVSAGDAAHGRGSARTAPANGAVSPRLVSPGPVSPGGSGPGAAASAGAGSRSDDSDVRDRTRADEAGTGGLRTRDGSRTGDDCGRDEARTGAPHAGDPRTDRSGTDGSRTDRSRTGGSRADDARARARRSGTGGAAGGASVTDAADAGRPRARGSGPHPFRRHPLRPRRSRMRHSRTAGEGGSSPSPSSEPWRSRRPGFARGSAAGYRPRGGPPFLRDWAAGERGRRLPVRSTAAVTAFVVAGTAFSAHDQPGRAGLGAWGWLLLAAACLLLLLRHRRPVATVYTVAGAVLVYLGAGYPYGPVFLTAAVASFAAIVAGHRKAAWGAAGALWAGHVLLGHWLHGWLPPPGGHPGSWTGETAVAAWMVAILVASELLRARREQWARDRAERAAAERRRRDEERLRIARELHDVLAHSISVINVQAGVGLALLDADPEQARTALATIRTASKEALGEVRQVLDTLRTPGDAPRAPAPGLARLPELAEQAAAAGLTVATTAEGAPYRLPPGADLAAFRIVQEALTNVVRHSGSRTATVVVTYEPDAVRLCVDDAGPATGADAGGGGNGLTGMRERAAALGGTVEAGPRSGGGFRVRVTLPLARPRGPGALPDDTQEAP